MKRAAVLWTGGKDSCLALYQAQEQGWDIACLATFVPEDEQSFRAHPQDQMRQQAQALGLELHFLKVQEPYQDSYISGLRWLQQTQNITAVVTGDIDLVDGYPNWIATCCQNLPLEVVRPLWQKPREELMAEIFARQMQVRLTWIESPHLPKEWQGQLLDPTKLAQLQALAHSAGIDLCGENGEYHTMVEGLILGTCGRKMGTNNFL